MKKILIGLHVPAIQEHYDLLVPANIDIMELKQLLMEGVSELSDGHYRNSGFGLLTLKDPDMLLQPGKNLKDYGVEDGCQLILF